MFPWRSMNFKIKLKNIYFNDLTITCHDQDEHIFHDKAVIKLGFETFFFYSISMIFYLYTTRSPCNSL